MEFAPLPVPVRIFWLLTEAAGLLTLVALVVRVARAVWRRDWRWLRTSGVLFLLTVVLLGATVTMIGRLLELSDRR